MISVITPVYKTEGYLDQCVKSILNQSYRDFEFILVDDGSPDRCGAMCDCWAEKDCRVKVIHCANNGVSAARNAGIDQAKGDYLCFVDSDDWVAEDYLETLYTLAKENEADMAYGIDGKGTPAYKEMRGKARRLYQEMLWHLTIKRKITIAAYLVSESLFKRIVHANN